MTFVSSEVKIGIMFAIILSLILIRPFISTLAFPFLNSVYSYILLGALSYSCIKKPKAIKELKIVKSPSILLFISALFLSAYLSYDKMLALTALVNYLILILTFLTAASLSQEQKNKIIKAVALSAIIISILAIYQYFFGFKHLLNYIHKMKIDNPFALDYIERKRVFFPFASPNILAGYLILCIPLLLITKNRYRLLFLSILLWTLFLTKSIGASLSLFLGMMVCLFLKEKPVIKKIMLLVALAGCFIFILMINRQTSIKGHTLPFFSLNQRLEYWGETFKIIKERPFGIGLGNFDLPLSRYAHNSYLQLWAETGILGLFSFLWLVVWIFRFQRRALKDAEHKREIAYLLSAEAAFLFHNLIDFTFFLPEVSLIWWVILGLTIPNLNKSRKPTEKYNLLEKIIV